MTPREQIISEVTSWPGIMTDSGAFLRSNSDRIAARRDRSAPRTNSRRR